MKNIVITGASSGIGRATAIEFAKNEGNNIFLISRNAALLNSILPEIKHSDNRIFIIPFDLITGDYDKLFSEINNKTQTIDILINNAGALVNKPFEEITTEEITRVMNTNFAGPFILTQKLLSLMQKGSHIVNITSMGGLQGSVKFPGLSLYSASKGALNTLTECLASELSSRDIAVNSLALGSVDTPMLTEAFPGYLANTSSGSISEFICWFAINGNRWMNGKIIPVANSTP